jgi:hypothetical protein
MTMYWKLTVVDNLDESEWNVRSIEFNDGEVCILAEREQEDEKGLYTETKRMCIYNDEMKDECYIKEWGSPPPGPATVEVIHLTKDAETDIME